MAHRRIEMGLVLVAVAMLCAGAAAQSSCVNTLVSLSPCLNYITGNSSTPSSGCCSQLASVVRSSPQCLCQVLNGGGSSLGININQTQALALPGTCKVQTPPTSQCNAASPPGTAATPAGTVADTPADSPNSVPSAASPAGTAATPAGTAADTPAGTVAGTPADSPNSVPSGTGSQTVPTTENGSSAGNSIKLSIPLFLILAATYASTFSTY